MIFDDSIHTPVFCSMLGGLAVPLVQYVDPSAKMSMKRIQLTHTGILHFICSVALYSFLGALIGHAFFDGYNVDLKVTYFYTGASAQFLLMRLITDHRDALLQKKIIAADSNTM